MSGLATASRAAKRFNKKVSVRADGCWIWLGARDSSGYGRFWLDGGLRAAHRVSFSWAGRSIPDGYELDHLCRTRPCVNPEHLEPVTREENAARGLRGYEHRIRCRSGRHAISDPGSVFVTARGKRECLLCRRESNRLAQARYRARKKRAA